LLISKEVETAIYDLTAVFDVRWATPTITQCRQGISSGIQFRGGFFTRQRLQKPGTVLRVINVQPYIGKRDG